MAHTLPASIDDRREPRLEVLHRTRIAHGNGVERAVTIVNVSAHGFMARADGEWAEGDLLTGTLPVVGLIQAEVRWALGGRIGCRLLRPVPTEVFEPMLHRMLRGS